MTQLRSLRDLAVRELIPLRSTVELLAPCNLKCTHCYVTHSRKTRLTTAVLFHLFDQMQAAGGMFVTLTGGEIGLRKDLFAIIGEARRRYLDVKLLTSGTLWGPREWDRIADLGVGQVRLSVYAVDAPVHDAVTCTPGSHEKTLATAMGLAQRGIKVELACPVMHTNAAQAGDVIALGNRLGMAVGLDPNITATDGGDSGPKSTLASFAQLVAMYRDPRVRELFGHGDSCEPSDDARPCGVGEISTFIRASGDVLPCSNWPHSAGNILEQPYLDIFRDSPVFAYCRALRRRDFGGCMSCGDKQRCRPCAAMNLRENGSVANPSLTVCDSTAARVTAAQGHSAQARLKPRLPIVA